MKDAEPGRIYTYDDIRAALQDGCDRAYGIRDVQAAVVKAMPTVQRIQKRALHSVPNVGYRVALANEHAGLAVRRQERSNRQLRMGLILLQNVRYDEMDENSRRAHEGHLVITSALYRNQVALEGRVRRVEAAIASLTGAST